MPTALWIDSGWIGMVWLPALPECVFKEANTMVWHLRDKQLYGAPLTSSVKMPFILCVQDHSYIQTERQHHHYQFITSSGTVLLECTPDDACSPRLSEEPLGIAGVRVLEARCCCYHLLLPSHQCQSTKDIRENTAEGPKPGGCKALLSSGHKVTVGHKCIGS